MEAGRLPNRRLRPTPGGSQGELPQRSKRGWPGPLVTFWSRKSLAACRRRSSPAKRATQRPDEGIGPYKCKGQRNITDRAGPAKRRAESSRPTPGKRLFLHCPLIRHASRDTFPPEGEGFRNTLLQPSPLGEGGWPKARRMRCPFGGEPPKIRVSFYSSAPHPPHRP